MVCVTSFESAAGTALRGEKFRADAPIVKAAPLFFMSADAPPSEWPSDLDQAVAANDRAAAEIHRGRVEAAKQQRLKLTAPACYRAKRDVLDVPGGRTVLKGSTLLDGDQLLIDFADDFEMVAGR
jgi:hypothetical protein